MRWRRALISLFAALITTGCADEPATGRQDADDVLTTNDAHRAEDVVELPKCGTVIELGVAQTNKNGRTPSLGFVLPATARSFTITALAPASVHVNVAGLTLGNGLSVVPKSWIALAGQPIACLQSCPNRVLAQPGAAAFLFPNTPLVKLAPGQVTFSLHAFTRAGNTTAPQTTQLQVRVHTVCDQADHPLRLALNIGLTGAGGLTAATAPADPRLKKALATAEQIFKSAGIAWSDPSWHDLPQHTLIAAQSGEKSAFTQLMRATAGQSLGIPVVLVDKILAAQATGPGESLLAGLSGGIPGPPLQLGNDRAGIAIALHLASGQPDTLGETIAHELAHQLGLFHTVEATQSGDPIEDNIPDTDLSTSNLMHWSVSEKSIQLSEGQREVLRNNPWLHQAPSAD